MGRLLGLGMVECAKGILDIFGHRNVNIVVFVVPFESHATVQGAFLVKGDGTVLLEGINKVLGILLVGVFDSKVVDT